jgi:hypothetical protein
MILFHLPIFSLFVFEEVSNLLLAPSPLMPPISEHDSAAFL